VQVVDGGEASDAVETHEGMLRLCEEREKGQAVAEEP
jgi:hypothetical protein